MTPVTLTTVALWTGVVLGLMLGALPPRTEPIAAPAPVVVVIRDRAIVCPSLTIDVSELVGEAPYPPADDEPPQRPWQELRNEKP